MLIDTYSGLLVQSKLPPYLAELLETDNNVIFISAVKRDIQNLTQTIPDTTICNLTGNPLEVDLSVLPTDTTMLESTESKEEKYVPISMNLARKLINDYNESDSKPLETNVIVCLCDGNDGMNTVMLCCSELDGNFIRCTAVTNGCTTEADLKHNSNALLDYHIQNVGIGSHKVDIQVMCLYELYGYKLSNHNLSEYCENNGCVQVESSWNVLQFNIPEHGAAMKLILQVLVGHEDSVVYNLYQELEFLRYCLNELSSNKTLEEVHLSTEPMDIFDIYQNISDVLHSVQVIKLPLAPQDNAFNYEKETNFTDELWNIFKCCGTVSDLSKCFQKLFEIIASEPIKIQMFEDDRSNMIGRVIQDIYSGRMVIPYLSAKQCLELFVELGLQKLKKNYLTIIKAFNFQMARDLQDKWNTLPELPLQTGRCTINGLNVVNGIAQAHFLFQVHIAIEFLPLTKEKCRFSPGVIVSVLKSVFNKYVMNTFPDSFYNNKRQLCDVTVPICFVDVKDNVLQSDCVPNKWKIRMLSNLKDSSVLTSFYYTRKPIFSSTVYKLDGTDSINTEDPKFYVTRLETYSDKTC